MSYERPEPWRTFWQTAGIHGCTEAFPPQARSAIAEGWRSFFRANSEARSLLDVASGRGAVITHAAEAGFASSDARLVGIDLVSGEALGTSPFLLRGNVDAANLPFGDRSFDLVTSQFGVEYADVTTAVSEAARVCARTLRFLTHDAESIVVRHGVQQAEQCTWLLAPGGIADRLRNFARNPTAVTGKELARGTADARRRAAADENRWLVESFCLSVEQIQANAAPLSPDERIEIASYAIDQLDGHQSRMTALRKAALDDARVTALGVHLGRAGLECEVFPCCDADGALLGRWIEAHRKSRVGVELGEGRTQ